MFYIPTMVCAFVSAYEHARQEEARFTASIAGLPPEQQDLAIRFRREAMAKLAEEVKIERRHEELCQAIRDSRPRGVGIFL
jgi:hypothetical protein